VKTAAAFCFRAFTDTKPLLASCVIALALVLATRSAHAVTVVPPGNRNAEQPSVHGASAERMRELGATYEKKFQNICDLLKKDARLRSEIRMTAAAYGIDPVHIVGAIVGEHTYNVDTCDRLQDAYLKAISRVNGSVNFGYRGESVGKFIKRAEFADCLKCKDSYSLWCCREKVWEKSFRGKSVDGTAYPDALFSEVFFGPFYAGQSFGPGQINLLTALKMSDRVHRVSGLPKLDIEDGNAVCRTVMEWDLVLPYIAATLRQSIDSYREIAGFDISRNPGVTATLYNTGGEELRAWALADKNARRKSEGLEPVLPQENYFGWMVNSRLDELKALIAHP